jgi:ATP-dependent Lon protease
MENYFEQKLGKNYIEFVNTEFNTINALLPVDVTEDKENYLNCEVKKYELKQKMKALQSEMGVWVQEQQDLKNNGIEKMRKEGTLINHLETLNQQQLARLANFCNIEREMRIMTDKQTKSYREKNSYRTYL